MPTDHWDDKVYRDTFENTLAQITLRQAHDPDFGVDQVRKMLESLYFDEGLDWVGRGRLYDLTHGATIAAWEHVLAELTREE